MQFPQIEDLSPLSELLCDFHHEAIAATKQHFVDSKHRYQVPGFFAAHVRSTLHDLLEPEGPNYGFSLDTSTGSLIIVYKNFLIKEYKAYNGTIPRPTKENKARLRFLNHNGKVMSWPQRLPGFEDSAGVPDGARIHFISYYDVTAQFDLAWFKIACPLSITSAGIQCLWNEDVEYSSLKPQPQKGQAEERPDLHITLLKETIVEEESDIEDDDENASGLG